MEKKRSKQVQILKFRLFRFYFSSNVDVVCFFELIVLRGFGKVHRDFLYLLWFLR